MFLGWSSFRHMLFLLSAHFEWLQWQPKCKRKKKKKEKKYLLKIISSETVWNIGLKLFRNIFYMNLYKFCILHCYCLKTVVSMVTNLN